LRERGFQPQNGIPGFSLHFPKELSYGYLRFEGNGKIPPISFKPKVAIGKCKKKSGVMKSGLDAMFFLPPRQSTMAKMTLIKGSF
jgi:hypothetical protein